MCESPAQLPPGAHPGTRLLAPFVSVCGEGAPGPGGQGHSPLDPGPHRVLLRGAPMCSLGPPRMYLLDVDGCSLFKRAEMLQVRTQRTQTRLTEDRRVAQTGHSAGWDGGHTGAQTHRMEGRVHSHGQDTGPKTGWCDMASGGASAGQRGQASWSWREGQRPCGHPRLCALRPKVSKTPWAARGHPKHKVWGLPSCCSVPSWPTSVPLSEPQPRSQQEPLARGVSPALNPPLSGLERKGREGGAQMTCLLSEGQAMPARPVGWVGEGTHLSPRVLWPGLGLAEGQKAHPPPDV